MIEPPAPLGMEAAGVVLESNAPGFSPGDRVAYACPPPGAYATMRTLPAAQLVPLPDHVSEETAAALMLKGMTAEYLLHRAHRVRPGDAVLVHAAAGGVGLLLCQWARALGARIIGTVSSEAKAELARANGCEHPIVTRSYAFAEKVKHVTGGRGADVIFDGLGREAAAENLAALARRGHWVSYGQATGALEPVNLAEKSGTFSQPVLFHYTEDFLHPMAGRVFAALRDGILTPDVRHRYPLAAAADAHRDLEARRTSGQIVLLP
jgi:NADPH:quinone reductase-like Zn-dependent oxidoreductase